MDANERAAAVGHIPSGLFIVTAKHYSPEGIDGFLGSWIQQVSFDPLMVSLCIKPGRPVYDAIKAGEVFTINVVGEHDKSYLKHFWKGYDPTKHVFDEIDHTETEEGAILINQAKSSIVCRMKESFWPGDHEIIVAEVLESYVHDSEHKPITHIRKNGLDY